MIKLIIFDWDDVFTLDSKKGYYSCLHTSITDLGVHLDPEEEHRRITSKWGRPHQEELAALLQEQPELLGQAIKIYEKHFYGDTFVNALGYVEGANELLNRLNKTYTLALATGAHPFILKERVMPRFQTPDVFAQIISGYEIENPDDGKPSPYMVNTIMGTQGFSKDETIVIGDAPSDMKMAINAGVTPVAVLTGHMSRQDAENLGIKNIIDNVTKLESVLEKLNKSS